MRGTTYRDLVSKLTKFRVLTYRRSGVGLPETDGFRLHGCLILLDERRWRCQRSRLVAPVLPKSTCTAVQPDAWQLDKHRVAQLKVKGRPAATLNCRSSRKRLRLEVAATLKRLCVFTSFFSLLRKYVVFRPISP